MSARTQRSRYSDLRRDRALVERRVVVSRTLARAWPQIGSAAIEDAVDEALAQIWQANVHLSDPDKAMKTWIEWAQLRLSDEHKSWLFKVRDPVDISDHTRALTIAVHVDATQLTDHTRLRWRTRELLTVLHGDQRRWLEAWFDAVLKPGCKSGAQPRGVPTALGWDKQKARETASAARKKMAAFMADRASGAVCEEQRGRLDAFIAATGHAGGQNLGAELERYEELVFHLVGCENCWAAWVARRATMRERLGAVAWLPVSFVHVVAGKLAGVAVGAHAASLSVRQRLGLGGGAGAAAAGGSVATVGTKAAAVCAAAVCAAGAGGELVGVLPPIVADGGRATARLHSLHHRPVARARARAAVRAASYTPTAAVTPTPPPPRAVVVRHGAVARSSTPPPALTRGSASAVDPGFTPGDLPSASETTAGGGSSSTTQAPPPPPPRPPPAAADGLNGCVPGDLAGC
jgi:hypothetical protein